MKSSYNKFLSGVRIYFLRKPPDANSLYFLWTGKMKIGMNQPTFEYLNPMYMACNGGISSKVFNNVIMSFSFSLL